MAKKAIAVKMPTSRTLFYNTGNISSVAWTTGMAINLPKDLAAINRHNVEHTTSKGVPLVYRCAITIMANPQAQTNNRLFVEDVNLIQIAEINHAPNTWVTRNAFVKAHAARENMFKLQGVKKSERGAYSRTIRPTWDASPNTFLVPQKGPTAGAVDVVGGTWTSP